MNYLLSICTSLKNLADSENHKVTSVTGEKMEVDEDDDEERKTTIRKCKTGVVYLCDHFTRSDLEWLAVVF